MVNGKDFLFGPWKDINWLIAQTAKHYAEVITPKFNVSMVSLTKDRVIKHRKWEPSMSLMPHIEYVLDDLGVFFVPRTMDPGPSIIFPITNYKNVVVSARVHPLEELVINGQVSKYAWLGKKTVPGAPSFFGTTDATLESIASYRSVGIVEGSYDLVAARVLHPNAPILSTGTKKMNEAHLTYLRLLGVKDVYVMFDNEAPAPGKDEGAGNISAKMLCESFNSLRKSTGVTFHNIGTQSEDCSEALKNRRNALALRNHLLTVFPCK